MDIFFSDYSFDCAPVWLYVPPGRDHRPVRAPDDAAELVLQIIAAATTLPFPPVRYQPKPLLASWRSLMAEQRCTRTGLQRRLRAVRHHPRHAVLRRQRLASAARATHTAPRAAPPPSGQWRSSRR